MTCRSDAKVKKHYRWLSRKYRRQITHEKQLHCGVKSCVCHDLGRARMLVCPCRLAAMRSSLRRLMRICHGALLRCLSVSAVHRETTATKGLHVNHRHVNRLYHFSGPGVNCGRGRRGRGRECLSLSVLLLLVWRGHPIWSWTHRQPDAD